MSTSVSKRSQLLDRYLDQLKTNPLRTKALTSAFLTGSSEYLASFLAGEKSPETGGYFTPRVYKMALYGGLISAPLSHFLMDIVQRPFRGKKGLKNQILQILTHSVFFSPIMVLAFLSSMAVISGAKTFTQIKATIKAAYFPILKSNWISAPVAIFFAQNFVPDYCWVPFFNLVGFVLVTYNNYVAKKRRRQLVEDTAKQQAADKANEAVSKTLQEPKKEL